MTGQQGKEQKQQRAQRAHAEQPDQALTKIQEFNTHASTVVSIMKSKRDEKGHDHQRNGRFAQTDGKSQDNTANKTNREHSYKTCQNK